MITIFCALYCEAQALIAHYQLNKDSGNTHFQVFGNEEQGIRIVITGAGPIAAATAVGSICTRYGMGKNDMLLNIGTCAGADENTDGIYLCNKLVEGATGRTFYPDMLYRHPFGEGTLITGDRIWQGSRRKDFKGTLLYDMEAAAVYQAGSRFAGPHRMQFIKIVSDHGEGQSPLPQSQHQISALIQKNANLLFGYMDDLGQILQREADERAQLSEEGQRWLARLSEDLHCSKVMQDEMRQQLWYQELSGSSYEAVILGMYEEGRLPCKDKRDGKKTFEELKQRLL